MRIEVRLPNQIDLPRSLPDYDWELDDIRSILSDICHAAADKSEFVISGFGQDRWPVDVGTDFAVVLEQLPELLRSVAAGVPGRLKFYEQGIERALVFIPAGDCYNVSCESYSKWQPHPTTERVTQAQLTQMLLDLRDKFMQLIRASAPELVNHPWVQSWLKAE